MQRLTAGRSECWERGRSSQCPSGKEYKARIAPGERRSGEPNTPDHDTRRFAHAGEVACLIPKNRGSARPPALLGSPSCPTGMSRLGYGLNNSPVRVVGGDT